MRTSETPFNPQSESSTNSSNDTGENQETGGTEIEFVSASFDIVILSSKRKG